MPNSRGLPTAAEMKRKREVEECYRQRDAQLREQEIERRADARVNKVAQKFRDADSLLREIRPGRERVL